MNVKFKPIDYLTDEEKELHELTRKRIKLSSNIAELEYYHKVLSILLDISVIRRSAEIKTLDWKTTNDRY